MDHLRALGLDVVHHLPGVGENLRDHYAPRFTGRAKNTSTINELTRGPKLLGEVGKYLLGRPSILGLGPTLVYCFWHSDPAIRNHDLQLTFARPAVKKGSSPKLTQNLALPVRPGNSVPNRVVLSMPGHLILMISRLFSPII